MLVLGVAVTVTITLVELILHADLTISSDWLHAETITADTILTRRNVAINTLEWLIDIVTPRTVCPGRVLTG